MCRRLGRGRHWPGRPGRACCSATASRFPSCCSRRCASAPSPCRSARASRRRGSPTCSRTPARSSSSMTPISPIACRSPRQRQHLAHRVAVEAGAPCTAIAAARARPAAAPAGGRRGGHRDHPLHLRHHRPAEGRDADPPGIVHSALHYEACMGLDGARPRAASRCRRATSPA